MTKTRFIGVLTAIGAAVLPILAHAQMSTSTVVTSVNSNITDVATILGGVIASILALLAALTGLGWGVRKFRQHVSGRKF